MISDNGRIKYIDGMRGIASILVILCHIACIFLPGLYFLSKAVGFEQIWINTPLNIITNGNIAVQTFFVLSGFCIAMKIYHGKGKFNPVRHYIKFFKIFAPAILFSFLLMVLGLMWHMEAVALDERLIFVNDYCNFTPTLTRLIADNLLVIIRSSNYVGPLWTIKIEILGSIIIMGLCYLARNNKHSKLIYIFSAFLLMFFNSDLCAFCFGALVFDCNYEKEEQSRLDKFITFIISKKVFLFILFIVGFYFASINIEASGVWSIFKRVWSILGNHIMFRSLGVAVLLLVISKSQILIKVLSSKPLVFLGKISPFTYAFHWPILLSVGCGIFVLGFGKMDYNLLIALSSFVSLVTSVVFSYLYYYTITKISKAIKNKRNNSKKAEV